MSYDRPAVLDHGTQVGERGNQGALRNPRENMGTCTNMRVRQQIPNRYLHLSGSFYRIADELIGIGIQAPFIAFGQKLGVTGNHAQRLLQIV